MSAPVMSPVRAANELTKAWRASRPSERWYPVDCPLIAAELGILVHSEEFPQHFEGMFRVSGETKAIIYNERIREPGRKAFTLAHELGHAALHRNHPELMCSAADLRDFPRAKDAVNPEQQANQFAAALLMPPDDVRKQIQHKPLTVDLAGQLTDRYGTTLTATSRRIIELSGTQAAAIVVVGDDLTIKLFWPNNVMRRTGIWLKRGMQVASDIFDHNSHQDPIDSHHWLEPSKARQWILYQSFTAMPYYSHSLFLLTAESTEGAVDYLDGIEDSTDQWPKW